MQKIYQLCSKLSSSKPIDRIKQQQ